jgi:hypothetical protein
MNGKVRFSPSTNNEKVEMVRVQDPRKSDLKYICLQVKGLEFFCNLDNLIKHSNYIERIVEKRPMKNYNNQIRIRLSD